MVYVLKSIVPVGRSGEWEVARYFHPTDGRTYTALHRGNITVMSDSDESVSDMPTLQDHAKGHVLVSGLGLGLMIQALDGLYDRMTIIEQSEDVIKLVWPTFQANTKIELVVADARTWEPPRGAHYDVAWHDIWDRDHKDNIPEMLAIEAKYADKVDWQDTWSWRHLGGRPA